MLPGLIHRSGMRLSVISDGKVCRTAERVYKLHMLVAVAKAWPPAAKMPRHHAPSEDSWLIRMEWR